jgi:hypothetical protein
MIFATKDTGRPNGKAGLTRGDLAIKAGLVLKAIWSLEGGKTRPSWERLASANSFKVLLPKSPAQVAACASAEVRFAFRRAWCQGQGSLGTTLQSKKCAFFVGPVKKMGCAYLTGRAVYALSRPRPKQTGLPDTNAALFTPKARTT